MGTVPAARRYDIQEDVRARLDEDVAWAEAELPQ